MIQPQNVYVDDVDFSRIRSTRADCLMWQQYSFGYCVVPENIRTTWFFRLDPPTPSEFPFQRGHV